MSLHVDAKGRPRMVNVSGKEVTARAAHARAIVCLPKEALAGLKGPEIGGEKGPVFPTAILAGIMAAKRTSILIPLCHEISLEDCRIHIAMNARKEVVIDCVAEASHKTGVEMEALVGASVAALTVYDMCKRFSHDIVLREIRLLSKTGGRSNYSRRAKR
jgi:cyclic pyranopterin monophosphate synthase